MQKQQKMMIVNNLFVILMIHHVHGIIKEMLDGKVYTISMEKTIQSYAVESCKSTGGKLYEPKNAITYDKVVKFAIRNGVTDFWLGIKFHQGKFVYQSDNYPLGQWKDWGYGHDDKKSSKHDYPKCDCVIGKRHYASSSYYHKWYYHLCSSHEHYVCEYCASQLNIHFLQNNLLEGIYIRRKSSTFYWDQVEGTGTLIFNIYDCWILSGRENGSDFINACKHNSCPNELNNWKIWENNSWVSFKNNLSINPMLIKAETSNPSPRSNEYKKDDQVGRMNTMVITILIATISLFIILLAAGLVFFYLRKHCARPKIIAEDETYYEANDIEFAAYSNPMPIDDGNDSNIKKIVEVRSRRNSNVDSFQSTIENFAVLDYTEPVEPIYENQTDDNDYQTIYNSS